MNHQLNSSVYRNSCKFGKAERFKPIEVTYITHHTAPLILSTKSAADHRLEQQGLAMEIVLDSKIIRHLVPIPTMSHNFRRIKEQLLLEPTGKRQSLDQWSIKLRRNPSCRLPMLTTFSSRRGNHIPWEWNCQERHKTTLKKGSQGQDSTEYLKYQQMAGMPVQGIKTQGR